MVIAAKLKQLFKKANKKPSNISAEGFYYLNFIFGPR